MKFGYMIDSSVYEPHTLEASSFSMAILLLEQKLDVKRMSQRKPDVPYVEIWEDKGIERKDMSFQDLSEVFKLYPKPSGHFVSADLITPKIWHEFQQHSDSIDDRSGKLTSNISIFPAGMYIEDVFGWLDAHATHGIKGLIFGIPGRISSEPVYLPCNYVSSWDGFGEVSAPAKYDPVSNKVYDVETADLSEEESAKCEILTGEYMDLLGSRFILGERTKEDTWAVEHDDPFYVISGITDLRPSPTLQEMIETAQTNKNQQPNRESFSKKDLDSHLNYK